MRHKSRGSIALAAVLVVGLVGAVALYFFVFRKEPVSLPQMPSFQMGRKFNPPKKSPHYEANVPEHGTTLPAVPLNIVIDFNFDLAPGSTITITGSGKDYSVGETTIDESKLALRRKMDLTAPDGIYTVTYKACWPDGSCHDGSFEFALDRSLVTDFTDLTNQKEIAIDIKDTAFRPQKIIIAKGTKITWTNSDAVVHYVNSDPHPGHNFYPLLNSQALAQGESYRYIFNESGLYFYHCSAHAGQMQAQIMVQ